MHISSPKTWRGGEQQLIYLMEELIALGVWQIVLCPFNSMVHKYCLKNHLNHVTYFKGFSANPMVAFRVSHICKREAIDLIHVHDSHSHNFAVLSSVLSKNEVPIIVSRRVDFPIHSGALSMFKYNHPRIARILCVSAAIMEVMKPFIDDKTKLEVVHSGIDLEKFNDVKEEVNLRSEFGIGDMTTLIGNVSALAPHKDYQTFIAVAKRVIESGKDVKFLAIGDGPLRKEVKQWIEEADMSEHIIMTGFRKDIPSVLPQLDVFLITSETEGLGTSILDAQAAGVPVVATKAGGIVEIIRHNENGMLAGVKDVESLAENVLHYLANPEIGAQHAENGKKNVERFSKQMTAKRTKEVYESVLGRVLEIPVKE
jgi:L-malate glycosyltransferase